MSTAEARERALAALEVDSLEALEADAAEFVHDAIAASAAGEGRRLGNRWGGGLERAPDELVARALRQTIAAGHPYAALPRAAAEGRRLADALPADRCGALRVDSADGTVLVCLLELDVDGTAEHLPGTWHGWVGREHADELLAAQVDPLERLARRWAHATA